MCVSWVDVSDPQAAYDYADAVVIGTASPTSDAIRMYGVDAAVHEITVAETVKGNHEPGIVRVASTPITCTSGDTYPDDNPLDVDSAVIVFLQAPEGEDAWSLITPIDTVIPVPGDGTLPFETEGGD